MKQIELCYLVVVDNNYIDTKCYFSSGFPPQCVDELGFSLFLKTYFEVDDFPADLCKHLFRYFQQVDQDGSMNSQPPKGGKSSSCI